MNVDIQEQLSCYSDELLDNEVQRRADVAKMPEAPRRLRHPEITRLADACHAQIMEIVSNGKPHDDVVYDIYSAAMMAMYGEKVFDWIDRKATK